ncbi:DUF4410 domain-containing protein [Wohlfahrtiimonas chitiniclastica]|uniref:DUF4410 domain-containing protein n=1 Tax=Wohlfahrtiimonas chitiniclastica TaxID=400946 RepID=UPI00215722E7|nr:DUF4410 domain-containing protein [Wohlfahrtiimonas chitiniclastica]MDC7252791.1 hypothetical protein [Wohlfahrtiimonas chitiniclastica]
MTKLILALSLTGVLCACSTMNTNHVKHSTQTDATQTSYMVEPSGGTEYDLYFEEALKTALKNAHIDEQSVTYDTIIKYDINMDEGSRALRYFVGFGAGKARALIEVKIINRKDHQELATLHSEATLSMGAFGGDTKGILNDAAIDIVQKIKLMNIFKRAGAKI